MRVGFLIDRWEPRRGGAEAACAALAAHLEGRGHDVRVFATTHAKAAPGRACRVRARGFGAGYARRLARALTATAEAQRCDVTVGVRHLERVDLLWPHGGSHAESLAARARAEGRTRGLSARQRLFLELERGLLEGGGARRVACVSQLVLHELAAAFPASAERLVHVPNGVDLARFGPALRRSEAARALRAELGLEAGTPLLAFAARRPQLKGLPQLFAALGPLGDRSSRPWHLLIAGPHRGATWLRAARRAGLAPERVSVRSHLPPEALFGAADLLLAPTWRDPCSLATLEALACGVPVLTTRANGAAEAFADEPDVGTVLGAPDDMRAWTAALDGWLERLAGGAVERSRVRATVATRGHARWMQRLETLLVELAAPPGAG